MEVHIILGDSLRKCKSWYVQTILLSLAKLMLILRKVAGKGLDLKVAYVQGDNLFEEMRDIREKGLPPHLDSDNSEVNYDNHTLDLQKEDKLIVSANAYLGAREI
jgi:hypothetical protein